MSKNIFIKSVTALLLGSILAGCGGGSSSSGGNTPATTALSGTAAVGFAVSNGTVNIKCASSTSLASATTSATGALQVTLSGQTLPCAIQVSGGTINSVANTTNYHSIATSAGNVNVTPLTDLLIANLAGSATPSAWFAGLTTTQLVAISAGQVTTAATNVKAALGLTTQLAGIDPITTAFTPTNDNVMDNTLEALQAAITNNGTSYANLLIGAGASANAGFTAPAGFNVALTSAYVPPAGGNTTPTVNILTPTTGAVSASMTITGTNLSAVTDVLFTGPSPSTAFVSGVIGTKTATSITTTVPASLTAGSYTVSVVHPGGEVAAASTFTVTASGGGSTGTGLTLSPAFNGLSTFSNSVPYFNGGTLVYSQGLMQNVTVTYSSLVAFNGTGQIVVSIMADLSGVDGYINQGSGFTVPACILTAVSGFSAPVCSTVGISFDKAAGSVSFNNTPMKAGYSGSATAFTLNGSLAFTPF